MSVGAALLLAHLDPPAPSMSRPPWQARTMWTMRNRTSGSAMLDMVAIQKSQEDLDVEQGAHASVPNRVRRRGGG